MSKIYLFLFIAAIVFLSLFGLDKSVQNLGEALRDESRYFFVDIGTKFEEYTTSHYGQKETILTLENQLEQQKVKNLILLQELARAKNKNDEKLRVDLNRTIEIAANDATDVNVTKTFKIKLDGKLQKVYVLSFVDFKDFSKVYLDVKDETAKIRGLIYDDMTAGIALVENQKFVGLLNTNEKCGYSVYVGKQKAPGVTAGIKHSNKLLVKYIPVWMDIKAGDDVITSGMDGIFFEGLRVGKVLSVQRQAMYQEATVLPSQEALSKRAYLMYSAN